MPQEEPFLMHYGVLGMKWGVRKDRAPGVSRSTDRTARKDAKEFTKAKMFYGESAGTRRKLINNTVKSRSKDAAYKKAFDYHVENTRMDKRASQARSERKRKDIRNSTAKTARGVRNVVTGNWHMAGTTVLAVAGAWTVARKTGVDVHIKNYAKTNVQNLANYAKPYAQEAANAVRNRRR